MNVRYPPFVPTPHQKMMRLQLAAFHPSVQCTGRWAHRLNPLIFLPGIAQPVSIPPSACIPPPAHALT
jgi:hypothetical protein